MRCLSPLLWFAASLILVVVVSTLGPPERSLGSHVRLVYLHGAWVWTALAGFALAGVLGIVGSGSPSIELFFLTLVALCLISGWQLADGWFCGPRSRA